MRAFAVALLALAALLPSAVCARTIDFSDLRKIITISEPQISPDGSRIVFVKGASDYAKDRHVTDLMLFNLQTRQTRQLTFGRRGVSEPRWSPDGSRVAFIAPERSEDEDAGEPQDQLYVLRFDGGDPKQVTHAENGVDAYAWSPDGEAFAFITQNNDPNDKQIKAHLDAFEVQSNDYLHQGPSIPSHLWRIGAAGGTAHRLTDGSWSLGTVDPYATSDISWSPDGRTIAVTRYPTADVGDSLATRVLLIDARDGRGRLLTQAGTMEDEGTFAPAGHAVAYIRPTHGDAMNGMAVYVSTLDNRAGSDVRASIDRYIEEKVWAAGGKALWLAGPNRAGASIWYVPLAGSPHQVALNGLTPSSLGNVSSRTGALVFTANTPAHPSELYVLPGPNARAIRLTNFNGWVSGLQLGRMNEVRWQNDGFAENGVVVLPPSYNEHRAQGRRYPLVLLIHGGPQGASVLNWSGQAQLFASHGYIVFEPNYRGSINLGDRYEHAIRQDTGDGPGRDVMAGINAVERTYPIDTSRIAVSGWSYGGFMTSWMIGHYNIWKAAVAGAALNDWFDDYNDAFYVYTDIPLFGGSPWNPRYTAMWRAQSPITYAQRIRTPTLIMGDIGDNNVTITNSFKMYHALKDNNVPVQFVAYPVHGHFPADPVRSEDVMRRWLAWLDRYLQ